MEEPWCEKYRPRCLSDVVGNRIVINRLATYVRAGYLPNIVMTGPSGTGKTSAILALCHDWAHCLGQHQNDTTKGGMTHMELNASDDRGVDTVRNKIKEFVCKKTTGIKLLILDEADGLTTPAQHALKSTMDRYPDARFALCCNDIDKIIPQVRSRCAFMCFKKLTGNDLIERIKTVASFEGISHTSAGLRSIAELSNGDLRCALNLLQSLAQSSRVTTKACQAQFGDSPSTMVSRALTLSMRHAENTREIADAVDAIITSGADHNTACTELTNNIASIHMPSKQKAGLLTIVGRYHRNQFINSSLSLHAMFCALKDDDIKDSEESINKDVVDREI